jgi:hypothetical protein
MAAFKTTVHRRELLHPELKQGVRAALRRYTHVGTSVGRLLRLSATPELVLGSRIHPERRISLPEFAEP